MDSLDELRKTVVKHQEDTDDLKAKFKLLDDSRARGKVERGVDELCEQAVRKLETQWLQLHLYLSDNYSGVESRAPILSTFETWVDVNNSLGDSSFDEVDAVFTLTDLAIADVLDGRALKNYFVKVPLWLPKLDALLNDRRDQAKAYQNLRIGLKVLEVLYRTHPKEVIKLFTEVGKTLGDALANIKVPVEQFCEAVISIVASILGKIWEWTLAGGDIVEWITDKAELQEFVAELADLIGELYPTITEVIGQNGVNVVVVMAQIVLIVLEIRRRSSIKLEELEISETD
jgi:Asp-tRNA(Asn)/Glu-tRNA(Gln) amidotransferase A subunit family amidase